MSLFGSNKDLKLGTNIVDNLKHISTQINERNRNSKRKETEEKQKSTNET